MWKTVRFGEADTELDVEVGFDNVSRERREWFHDGCFVRVFYDGRLVSTYQPDGRDLHPKLAEELIETYRDVWFREWIKGSY